VRGADVDASLGETIRDQCEAAGLTLDGRLANVADALARHSEAAQRAPSYAQVNHYAQREGLPEPTPEVWLASAGDAGQLLPSVTDAIREATHKSKLSHCGGAIVREGNRLVVALAWSARLVDLDLDVPAQLESKASARLRGKLLGDLKKPVLAVTDPSGHVSRSALGEARSFDHNLTFPERGMYAIELLGEGAAGVAVVANFPIAVGVARDNGSPKGDDGPVEANAEEVIRSLAALIAKEREQRKLPPLTLDTRLAKIAQSHCQDMLANGFIAHTSPSTGEASNRVSRAGLAATVVLENIGRGYSASEIHQGLMESPGHRGNILSPDARELGIGVVSESEGGRLAFLTTELFTRLAREVSIADAPDVVARDLQVLRREKRLKPIKFDAGLAKAAQQAADRLAADPTLDQGDLLERATENVQTPPKGAKAVGAILLLAADLDQVIESERLLEPKLGWLGVGVARSKAVTASPLIVVLVFGTSK